MSEKYIISVDLGGTKILSALLSERNKIIDRVKTATDISKGPDYIVDSINSSIKELIKKNGKSTKDIKGVCLGVPGTVNPTSGIIGDAPNLKIKNYNIKKALQQKLDLPVIIENDVNLAALGIKRFEFKDKVNNMLVVFVGTGIGGALIFNNHMYRGSSFYAGEIGHMKVNDSGEFSNSGINSTFENQASRTAIVNSILNDIKEGKKSVLSEVKKIKSKNLANAISQGDKIAVKYVDKACKTIGTVLGSLTTLLNIDTIVLGGGVLEAMGDYMLPLIERAFKKAVLPEPGENVKIVVTKLGDDAPLYGGISLADEFVN
ncbi:MAG: ROK family protein [Melioribacteraceae bacterium]|nr:ROK family protein [Melioribacteraceae bacterium]